MDTSEIEMVDVSAAMNSNKKKIVDHIRVAGICAKTSGSVTKTSAAPSRLLSANPKDITAGKMMIPH